MRLLWAAIATLALAACSQPAPRKAVPTAAVDADWPTIPADAKFGEVSAVDVDSKGNVFVLHRAGRVWEEPFPNAPIAEPTVFVLSPAGKLIAKWGAGLFVMPHGLSIDAEDKVWITDVGREQVFRFSHSGEQELALGERGVSRQDAAHFGRPADIAFIGERVLVADGYVNTRIAEFDREGRFIKDWGDFRVAHAVATDGQRIYVADRENARITVHDLDGKLLAAWTSPGGNHTYGLKPLGGGRIIAVEGRDGADRRGAIVRIYGADGKVERAFDVGLPGEDASLGHDIALGLDGKVYVTDVPGGRVVRFAVP